MISALPTIIRIIKSRRMRWTGHVARMDEKKKISAKFRRKKGAAWSAQRKPHDRNLGLLDWRPQVTPQLHSRG
jgi:hypothetical protein